MPYRDLVSRVDFDMRRDSPFSYACHACNRCCRNKAIRVSPYEILRLARFLGISTTQFVNYHTAAGGTVLRTKENGDCQFLGKGGCGVHPDRPLACRLYPLARWVSPDGEESFGHPTPHPETAGVYGKSGTVQDGAEVLDLDGQKIYELKGINLYRLSGELVGHLNSAHGSEKRLDRSTDRLFPVRGGSRQI
jgi:uncharacterized protein